MYEAALAISRRSRRVIFLGSPATRANFGQWGLSRSRCASGLMQPDNPFLSCCGEADAYWVDNFEVDEAAMWPSSPTSVPDGPLGRMHREVGETVLVPNSEVKWDDGNPTGHGIISMATAGEVYC